ncbi:hypothetical protein GCM10009673_02200 [Nesterenkonia sandarakina]
MEGGGCVSEQVGVSAGALVAFWSGEVADGVDCDGAAGCLPAGLLGGAERVGSTEAVVAAPTLGAVQVQMGTPVTARKLMAVVSTSA